MPLTTKVGSLQDAMTWLDRLERTGTVRTTGAWPLSAVQDANHQDEVVEAG
jgi:hypothetical protein